MLNQKNKSASQTAIGRRRLGRSSIGTNAAFLLMVLPGFLLTFVFCYMPIGGLVIAFKNIDYAKGIFGSDWVGLKNFKFLFDSPDLPLILKNTIGYNIIIIALGSVFPTIFSIGFSLLRNKRGGKVYQTLIMLPYFISWIIVTYIVYSFLSYSNGLVNHLLLRMGKDPVNWYSQIKLWPGLLIFLALWKSVGYSTVVYIATISGIDSSLYEAASIDGANKWHQIWYVTLPELSSVIIIMLILAIGRILSADFSLFYNVPMESGALMPVTNVISTYVYRALMLNADIGMSSAAGFFQSVVGFILVMLTNWVVRMIDEEKSLF